MIKFIHFPCWEVCDYTKEEQCFSNFTITSIRKSTPVMTVIISFSHPKRSDIIHFGTRFKRSWTGQLHWCSLRVRGYSRKTSSLQHQQGQWNWDSWSVDAYDQTTQQLLVPKQIADEQGAKKVSFIACHSSKLLLASMY